MAIQKLEELYLYYSDAFNGATENIKAVALVENSGVPFTRMYFNAQADTTQLFEALNSWWVKEDGSGLDEVNTFPFITYVEVHDDIPARLSPVKYAKGYDGIKSFLDFYNSIMTEK
jgi:hypothetical protein